ncbi:pantoate--beta-alanine ligase [Planctomicrobium piriforme]|uniref:Pantothenate synthetase n=1 Tax=Planctomicrobium piriforme TaxID=1576369 RepID=A0A1I3G7R1_9PLAN|nr:pantoate--beta-alanine ligase [Planctomicrobium piriforme]SFI19437.1 pantoate--beta-alanine ligase [Planctomicrobium piriforme]
MDVTGEIGEVRRLVAAARQRGCGIGCVPTMGALHPGHVSLVAECRKRVDYTVLTIFVNPTQFAPHEDLNKYPRPIEADLAACRAAGVDCVFMPEISSLYPPGYDTWVTVEGMSSLLEGEFRPGHFRGVATIVAKLFNIVHPDIACFGSKDYQQQSLIRQMVRDLNQPVEIVVCPTIREPDGLAMSSRNVYLSPSDRETAVVLSRSLRTAEQALLSGERDVAAVEARMRAELESKPNVRVQYAVIRDPVTLQPLTESQPEMVGLIAAYVGQTRLIDHLTIRLPRS